MTGVALLVVRMHSSMGLPDPDQLYVDRETFRIRNEYLDEVYNLVIVWIEHNMGVRNTKQHFQHM
jgi:hypothetical protein